MFYRAPVDMALIRNGLNGTRVYFKGAFGLPFLHRFERVQIGEKRIDLSYTESEGISFRDGIKGDIVMSLSIRIKRDADTVEHAWLSFGSRRMGDADELKQFFFGRFTGSIKGCARKIDFADAHKAPDQFCDSVLAGIDQSQLYGYQIEEVTLEKFERTALEFHDQSNIIDAEGFRKITELEAEATRLENEARRKRELEEARKKHGQ